MRTYIDGEMTTSTLATVSTTVSRSTTTTMSVATAGTTGTNSEHATTTMMDPATDGGEPNTIMKKPKSSSNKMIQQTTTSTTKTTAKDDQVRANVNEYARKTLKEKFQNTTIVDESKYLPHFTLNEVIYNTKKPLGKGNFGIVYEI